MKHSLHRHPYLRTNAKQGGRNTTRFPSRCLSLRKIVCLSAWTLSVWIWASLANPLPAQSPPNSSSAATSASVPTSSSVTVPVEDLQRWEKTLQAIVDENARLSQEIETLKGQSVIQAIEPYELSGWIAPSEPSSSATQSSPMDGYYTGYDKGIFIRPRDGKRSPYSLKINHQNTFRYTGFASEQPTWVDSAGVTNPIFNRNDFAIPRGRLIFSGDALMPDLSYLLSFDYNTVNNNPIGFRAYVLSYKFNQALQAHVGQNKVPGTREWIASSFDTQEGPDRSMAATFFRPSLSQGVWLTGEPTKGFYYHAMVSNGFNTLNLSTRELNDRFCISESVWWEPWGDFGKGYSDLENHVDPVVRLGSCCTYTMETGSQVSDYPENTLVRLSDGTLITQQSALAPGVTVQAFHLSIAAIDLSLKYRGLSLSTELYHQGLSSFKTTGPIPVNTLQTYGGVLQGGYFISPQRVELYSRSSMVTGKFGSGTEIAGGVNWFPMPGSTNFCLTFDSAWLDSSPADQNRTGFVAGQSGVLFRSQLSTSF